MLILEPFSQFLIEFFRNNPSDTATYYVQSKVYNSIDGSLLATVNLTDKGNGYFSKLYALPGDTFGNGRQITIISTCYTDAGYTSISGIYGATLEKYIIRHLASQNLGGFTRGIELGDIEGVVKKLLGELPKPAPYEKYDDSALHARLDGFEATMNDGFIRHQSALEEAKESLRKEAAERQLAATDELKSHVRDTIASLGPNFGEIKDSLESNRMENYGLHSSSHQHLEDIKGDKTLHNKIDSLSDDAKERHEEVLEQLDQPVMIRGDVKRGKKMLKEDDEDAEQKAEKRVNERKMTVEKLIALSKS